MIHGSTGNKVETIRGIKLGWQDGSEVRRGGHLEGSEKGSDGIINYHLGWINDDSKR